MVTQKAICVKLNTYTLEQLDKEVSLGWKKRNRLINEAVMYYLEVLDYKRRIHSYQNMSDKDDEVRRYVRRQFPEVTGGEIIKSIY